jgi:hypothetical protein
MQKARRHPSEDRLRPLVSMRFQVLFTPLVGVLFIIQSPYWFAIGRQEYLALGGGPPSFTPSFTSSDATLVHLRHFPLYRTFTFFGDLSRRSQRFGCRIGARNPGPKDGLGYSDFARRY